MKINKKDSEAIMGTAAQSAGRDPWTSELAPGLEPTCAIAAEDAGRKRASENEAPLLNPGDRESDDLAAPHASCRGDKAPRSARLVSVSLAPVRKAFKSMPPEAPLKSAKVAPVPRPCSILPLSRACLEASVFQGIVSKYGHRSTKELATMNIRTSARKPCSRTLPAAAAAAEKPVEQSSMVIELPLNYRGIQQRLSVKKALGRSPLAQMTSVPDDSEELEESDVIRPEGHDGDSDDEEKEEDEEEEEEDEMAVEKIVLRKRTRTNYCEEELSGEETDSEASNNDDDWSKGDKEEEGTEDSEPPSPLVEDEDEIEEPSDEDSKPVYAAFGAYSGDRVWVETSSDEDSEEAEMEDTDEEAEEEEEEAEEEEEGEEEEKAPLEAAKGAAPAVELEDTKDSSPFWQRDASDVPDEIKTFFAKMTPETAPKLLREFSDLVRVFRDKSQFATREMLLRAIIYGETALASKIAPRLGTVETPLVRLLSEIPSEVAVSPQCPSTIEHLMKTCDIESVSIFGMDTSVTLRQLHFKYSAAFHVPAVHPPALVLACMAMDRIDYEERHDLLAVWSAIPGAVAHAFKGALEEAISRGRAPRWMTK